MKDHRKLRMEVILLLWYSSVVYTVPCYNMINASHGSTKRAIINR